MILVRSLSGSIIIGMFFLGVLFMGVSQIVWHETNMIYQQAAVDRAFMTILNTVLEIRRYEKSYLLFRNKNDFENTLNYLDQTDHRLREHRDLFSARKGGAAVHRSMSELSVKYRELFIQYSVLLNQETQNTQISELELHQLGRKLITLAEQMATDTEDEISEIFNNTQIIVIASEIVFIGLLFLLGAVYTHRINGPHKHIRDSLSHIIAGRHERIKQFSKDHDVNALINMINLTLDNILHKQEDRLQIAQHAFTDAVLLRLIASIRQPMANISTTCQIMIEEGEGAPTLFQRDMILQIQQQAEQARRMLAAIQEYSTPRSEPDERINVRKMIDNVLKKLQEDLEISCVLAREIAADLETTGNPHSLERGVYDVISYALQSASPGQRILLEGSRRKREEIRKIMDEATIAPLTWLRPDCDEVVEIVLPIDRGDRIPPGQSVLDVSSLCVPQENGNPGLCLLPGIMRQHSGALLARSMPGGVLELRLWLPMAPLLKKGTEHSLNGI